ncbi:MAG: hypothetical protein ABSE87_09770 [Terracidiphilus sp.]
MKQTTVLVAVLVLIVTGGQVRGQQNDVSGSKPLISSAEDLQKPAVEVRSQSQVPPRLPSFLPYLDDSAHVYLTSKDIGPSGYDLELGFDRNCEGQHVCFYASFQGRNALVNLSEVKPVRVKLRNGIRGWFYPPQIGAYCSNSSIRWAERGFYYSIEMKCENRGTLVKLANSAISVRQQFAHGGSRY